MKEINLKEETVFYNTLKRIDVAAKRGYANSKEILGVPAIKCAVSNKWFTVGSRLTPYRLQDLFPVENGPKGDYYNPSAGQSGQLGNAA